MLVVMLGLSHGMLNEVADRVESVEAELIVLPENENIIFTAGAAFPGKVAGVIDGFELEGQRVIKRTIGVMFDTVHMGGQQQRLFGVDREDMAAFLGRRKIVEGRLFDEGGKFANRLDSLRNEQGYYDPSRVSDVEVAAACELVIDTRLARVGHYALGDEIDFLGRRFEIVGIVESGVAGRVFCPVQVLQNIKNGGAPWVSMFFVQLHPPSSSASKGYEDRVAEALGVAIRAKVESKSTYRELLYDSFSQVYVYINTASGMVLLVCFIFILLSMYTMVLERTREIGILKSLGASRFYLVREAILEAVIVCVSGTVLGIGMACGAKYGIERVKPLLTVSIEWAFIGTALLIGVVGGTLSALYPGYRAAKLDPVAALNFD